MWLVSGLKRMWGSCCIIAVCVACVISSEMWVLRGCNVFCMPGPVVGAVWKGNHMQRRRRAVRGAWLGGYSKHVVRPTVTSEKIYTRERQWQALRRAVAVSLCASQKQPTSKQQRRVTMTDGVGGSEFIFFHLKLLPALCLLCPSSCVFCVARCRHCMWLPLNNISAIFFLFPPYFYVCVQYHIFSLCKLES